MIEAAYVIFTLLAVTIGIVDAAFYFIAFLELNVAVDKAARCAAVTYQMPTNATVCPDIQAYAAKNMIITKGAVFHSVLPQNCGLQPSGAPQIGVLITGTYPFNPIFSYVTGSFKHQIKVEICYPIARNTTN